ncbi:Cyclin-P3-1 [Rhynchospora pubera]|uniref:Cyclin n=1 Tax=Rhynchospora pubera TaxID=906938 RepID=A0AAV8ARX8_9POAL|nr:Cyclin-P3-1 [Rhynchospora pubera]KAJ4786343.1 Cyclin-P3-1 [Rhynchospora pubera]KAJ4804861.1 Cyclin-P3-1 [Rhynchospora pubera]
MWNLPPDSEDLCTEAFLSLGLSMSEKGANDFPRVLLLLSSFLDRAVQNNEKLLDSKKVKEPLTVFHGLKAPNLGIQRYMERIYKYSKCSPSCFVLGLVYMDRYLQQPGVCVTSLNVHRLLITSVVLAAKFIDDAFYNNAYYAKVGGISTREMNRLELNMLFCIDFRLKVDVTTFGKYCLQLEKEATIYQVEWPIKACALVDINNLDDTKCRSLTQRHAEVEGL